MVQQAVLVIKLPDRSSDAWSLEHSPITPLPCTFSVHGIMSTLLWVDDATNMLGWVS